MGRRGLKTLDFSRIVWAMDFLWIPYPPIYNGFLIGPGMLQILHHWGVAARNWRSAAAPSDRRASARRKALRGLRQHTWLWPWRRRPKRIGETFGIGLLHPGSGGGGCAKVHLSPGPVAFLWKLFSSRVRLSASRRSATKRKSC